MRFCQCTTCFVAHQCPYMMSSVQSWMKNTSHLQRDISISINKGVWEWIILHTGITDCDLFSQSAVPIIPTPLPMKSPPPIVPVATWGYLKSLQTNSWQMRWNSTFMKIWTWTWLYHEKALNIKWEGGRLMFSTVMILFHVSGNRFRHLLQSQWFPSLQPAHECSVLESPCHGMLPMAGRPHQIRD